MHLPLSFERKCHEKPAEVKIENNHVNKTTGPKVPIASPEK